MASDITSFSPVPDTIFTCELFDALPGADIIGDDIEVRRARGPLISTASFSPAIQHRHAVRCPSASVADIAEGG
jgi:hypothetical protein